LPKFSPRTGVEHARHIGRPHPSHRATAGLPGCRSHRSRTLDERSSGGTTEGYRHPRRRWRLTVRRTLPSVRDVTARVAVLASGTGTNLQALLDDPVVGRWVVLAMSDRADARALDRARSRSVEAVYVDPAAFGDRDAFDHTLVEMLR